MSTQHRTRENDTDYPRFISVSGVDPVAEADLVEMDGSEAPRPGDTIRLYAVARRDGVIMDGPGMEGVAGDGATVLYVTADGEHAVECRYRRQTEGDWSGIPYAVTRAPDEVTPAGSRARNWAQVALPSHASQGTIQTETDEDGGGQ